MSTGFSEDRPNPKKSKTVREKLGFDEKRLFYGEQPSSAPGLFRLLDIKNVKQELGKIGFVMLHPITLTAKESKGSNLVAALSDAAKGDLAFSKISSCVSADICGQTCVVLQALLPNLQSFLTTPSVTTIYRLICHIWDIYKAEKKDWKESPSGAMETHDQHLWSKICCAVIEGSSAVFKECTITSKNDVDDEDEDESLPHGDIDLVAGRIENSGEINWSFGVQLLSEDEIFELQNPIGISNKTQKTLATGPPNTQLSVEGVAFPEVVKSKDSKRPVVFFGGTWEAFRPFIRVKELDLLLTTGQSILWWDIEKEAPNLPGIVLLIVLMLGASSTGYGLELSSDALYLKNAQMKWPVTGWNEYYDTRGKKYADKLKAKKRDPVPSVSGKPRQTDPKKIYASEQFVKQQLEELEQLRRQSGKYQ